MAKMKRQGVEYIHILRTDNILNKLADPIMVGKLVDDHDLEMISKYSKKTNPDDKSRVHVL
jgi:UDP-N-acetylglucosamine pyrophosphorylase